MIGAELSGAAADLAAARRPFVIATVVRVEKPTSAQPGDTALVLPDGTVEGFVGGACTVSTVRMHGLRVLETERPLLLRIQPEAVAAEPSAGIAVAVNPCLSGGAIELFLEPRLPPPLVRVVGDSPVVEALRRLGEPLGLEVRPGEPQEGDDAVVIAALGHGDAAAVRRGLDSSAPYVGLVASRRRGQAVIAEARAGGCDEQRLDRLHTPAGLDIGARTHAEIALSILAEIVQVRARTPDRGRPAVEAPAGMVDPVCGMVEPAAGGWRRAVHGGVEYAFCCDGCAQRFAADPAPFLPAAPGS